MNDLLDLLDTAGGETCVCHPAPKGGWTVLGFTDQHQRLRGYQHQGYTDVYVGVNPVHADLVTARNAHARGSKQHREISAYRAAHCELDYGKTPGYPTDHDTALAFLHQFPLPPSVIIWSGGGFHGWWILEHPIPLTPDNDRGWRIALDIESRWKHLFLTELVAAGFVRPDGQPGIDRGTFDLSRVLRLPGTIHSRRGNLVSEVGGTGRPVPNEHLYHALPPTPRPTPTPRRAGDTPPDLDTGPMCHRMARFTSNALTDFDHSDRHGWLARKTLAALHLQAEGHRGAEHALTTLVDAFRAETTRSGDRQRTPGEADAEALRLIEGARRLAPPAAPHPCTCY